MTNLIMVTAIGRERFIVLLTISILGSFSVPRQRLTFFKDFVAVELILYFTIFT